MKRTERIGETLLNNFGSTMIITGYENKNNIRVYFPEYDYTVEHAYYCAFKKGNIKCPYEPRVYGVGCIGEGTYKAVENKKQTKEYSTWHAMLMRCYDSKYQEKNPTYKDCYVCKEWLNFQTFCEWFHNNYYEINGECTDLDKDITIKDNKIYSPETCVFVPHFINSLFVKCDASRNGLPIGVSHHKKSGKYRARCNINFKEKSLGLYDTQEEAFQAYKTFKEAYIKKVANDYIELIPFNLYQIMLDYEVEIDD